MGILWNFAINAHIIDDLTGGKMEEKEDLWHFRDWKETGMHNNSVCYTVNEGDIVSYTDLYGFEHSGPVDFISTKNNYPILRVNQRMIALRSYDGWRIDPNIVCLINCTEAVNNWRDRENA